MVENRRCQTKKSGKMIPDFLNVKTMSKHMDKLNKKVKKRKKPEKVLIQVFHTKNTKKRGKFVVEEKLSTLSTQKHMFSVDNLRKKKNGRFVEKL